MNKKTIAGCLVIAAALVAGFLVWRPDRRAAAREGDPAKKAGAIQPIAVASAEAAPAQAALAGRVTDASGAPLAGAMVRLAASRDDEKTQESATARSGPDGGYRFDRFAPGRYHASASAPGHLPRAAAEMVVLLGGETTALDFTLEAGGRTLSGTVSDAIGGPIAGALVEAMPVYGMLSLRGEQVSAAITDGEGRFALQVADGRHRVGASHPEYVPASQDLDVGVDGATVAFSLVPGSAVEGIVRELGTGTPVPGARVIAQREALAGLPFGESMAVGRGRAAVTAGADGRFRIAGVEPGTLRLRASAAGRHSEEPAIVALGIGEQVVGVEVFVAPSLSISGTVTLEGGAPAAGAAVTVMAPQEASHVIADEQGRFFADGLQPGDYAILGGGGEYLPAGERVSVTVVDRPVSDVRLTVRKGAMIQGRVDPAGVAEVTVARGDDAPNTRRLLGGGDPSALADADGTFSIGPFEPGASVALTAKAPDGRRGEATVAVPRTGGADGVVIALEERGSIAGRVLDGDREPVPGAVVSVRPIVADRRVTMIVNGLDVSADRAPTSDDGSFAIRGLEAGDYEVTVLDAHGQALSWAKPKDKKWPGAPIAVALKKNEHKEGVDLVVEIPDGVIRGVVYGPDGSALRDAWVTAIAAPAFGPGGPDGFGGPGGPDGFGGPGGPDGFGGPDGPGGPGGGGGGGSGGGDDGDDGTTPAEGTRSVSRTVMMVTDDEGGGGGASGIAPVLTDESGKFEIRGLRRVPHRLLGEGLKGRARGTLTEIRPDAEVSLKLAALTEVVGKVTTADGTPVTDFTIDLDGDAHHHQRFRAADGTWTIQRIDPGSYRVRAVAKEGTGTAEVVAVTGQKIAVATIAVVGNAHVIGKVVDDAGNPVVGMSVLTTAAPEPGAPRGSLSVTFEGEPPTTGPDGRFDVETAPGKRLVLVLGAQGPAARAEVEARSGETVDAGTLTVAAGGTP